MDANKPKRCTCDARHTGRLDACGFDPIERTILTVARQVFVAFTQPQSQSWICALETAERSFAPPFGPAIALATVRALQALRSARTSCFVFSNPYCETCRHAITQEERLLISTFRAVQQGNRAQALTFATMVCEGTRPDHLVDAFEELARILGEGPLAEPPSRRKRMSFRWPGMSRPPAALEGPNGVP
ncbi:MAG: hypothetical protein AAFU49_00315 [Pseudomonadota bacterium]